MLRTPVLIACWLAAAAVFGPEQAIGSPQVPEAAAAVPAAPSALLDRYCVTCHNDAGLRRGTVPVSLQAIDTANVGADAALWESVLRKLRAGMMPPAGRPRPDQAAHDRLLAWLEGELDRAAAARPNPGRTETFHRLNRTEYANVIRDLLALDIDAAALLPADDASYGFDNIAGVLRLNQSLMERYLAAAAKISRAAVGRPLAAPTAHEFRIPDSFAEHARLMFDLQLLAYQTDITRVVTFQIGRELSTRSYAELGVLESHHDVSHHQSDPLRMAKNTKINLFHMSLFAEFVEKLRATPDGDGTLLDHAMLLYGGGLGDGDRHLPHDLPLALVGGGCGQLRGGRHLVCETDTPLMNLGLSLLDKVGVELDSVGDSTGRLTGV